MVFLVFFKYLKRCFLAPPFPDSADVCSDSEVKTLAKRSSRQCSAIQIQIDSYTLKSYFIKITILQTANGFNVEVVF